MIRALKVLQKYFEERSLCCSVDYSAVCRFVARIKNVSASDVRFGFENIVLSDAELKDFQSMYERYLLHEPVSKILNSKEFWESEFYVNHDVLDPRPETELIIEAVLSMYNKDLSLKILDVGTGSGCILLSLLLEYANATGIGIDASAAAIDVANRNKNSLNVSSAEFQNIGWSDFSITDKFSLVVSNPPYIKTSDIETLHLNVKKYDPMMALDGGSSGLVAYEEIAALAKHWLTPDGVMVLEIGYRQKDEVSQILSNNMFRILDVQQDLMGVDRVIVAQILL